MSNTNITLAVSTGKRQFALKWNEQEQQLHVEATSQPEKGKANKEILQKLKKLFKSETIIVSGMTSRKKVIQVALDNEQVMKILHNLQLK